MDRYPQSPRLESCPEGTGTGEIKEQGCPADPPEFGVELVRQVLTQVAGELQGDMQGLPGPPGRPGQALLEGFEGIGGLVGQGQGGEQADHFPKPTVGAGLHKTVKVTIFRPAPDPGVWERTFLR